MIRGCNRRREIFQKSWGEVCGRRESKEFSLIAGAERRIRGVDDDAGDHSAVVLTGMV
jgi:hypothetical protein